MNTYPWNFPSRSFAQVAHGGKPYGKHPYVVHLDHTVQVLLRFGITNPVIIDAAFLHDTVEDCDVDVEYLKEKYSEHTAAIVDAVSDGPGDTREEQKKRPYELIPQVEGAVYVKLADRIANVESCMAVDNQKLLDKYLDEYPGFRRALYIDSQDKSHEDDRIMMLMWFYLDGLHEMAAA